MTARTLLAIALGFSVGLLIVGWLLGFTTQDVATGLTTTGNCGSPWSPEVSATTPFSDASSPSPELCAAAFGSRGVLAAALTAAGFLGLIGTVLGQRLASMISMTLRLTSR